MRDLERIAWIAGAMATAVMIACGDKTPAGPGQSNTRGGAARLVDTLTAGPTSASDSARAHTDTVKPRSDSTNGIKPSSDPRKLIGVVHAIGAKPDTSKYELVGGATVVLTLPDDSTHGVNGLELARATSAADGSFSLGAFKPGVYVVTVIPPANSAFTGTHWGFLITDVSAPTIDLGVWLGRK
jgi:hypothetical protein